MNNFVRLGLIMGTVLMLANSPSFAASIYKWVDDKGTTQYTALPPTDRPSEKIKTYAGNSKGSASSSPAAPEKPTTQEAAANQPPVSKKDPERCAWAKKNLETLNTNSRIKIQDDKGEIRYLDQKEISEKRKESQIAIDESC